jgi:Flp pilus assembly protein TadD
MAFCERLNGPRGRAHIQKALALEPRDSQTLYWAGITAYQMGNFRLANDFFHKSASLDPLWKRPIIQSGLAALEAGDRAAADRHLQRMKRGNSAGSSEVEIAFSYAEGDFSKAIEIAVKGWASWSPWDAGMDMAQNLLASRQPALREDQRPSQGAQGKGTVRVYRLHEQAFLVTVELP